MPDIRDPDGSQSPSIEILNPAPAAAVTPAVVDSTATVPPSPEAVAVDVSTKAVEPAAPAVEAPIVPEKLTSLLDKHDADQAAKDAAAAKPVEDKKPEAETAKPVDAAPIEGDKPAEVAPEAPAELPKIDYFEGEKAVKLPEVLKMDDAAKASFTEALDSFRKDPSIGAQAIIDMGAKAFQEYATELHAKQWQTFNEMRGNWVKDVMSDPVLGGAGHETAMGTVARVRDRIISNAPVGSERYKTEQAEWQQFLDATGAGDNRALLRALHNAGRFIDEAKPVTPDIKPTKDNGRGPSRGRLNYAHPTSNPER